MMRPLYLRFNNEADAVSTLLDNGFSLDTGCELVHPSIHIDVLGELGGDPVYDEHDNCIGFTPRIDGYHVNLLVPDSVEFTGVLPVVYVRTPVRVWAGY